MRFARLLMAVAALSIASGPPVLGADATWLLGSWVGERDVGKATRDGSDRVLTVRSVSADGTSANATWRTDRGTLSLKIKIAGEHINFSTGFQGVQGADYSLDRRGNALVGTYTGNEGKPGAITLKKQN
jgi:hypothetical protein